MDVEIGTNVEQFLLIPFLGIFVLNLWYCDFAVWLRPPFICIFGAEISEIADFLKR